jgi:hypothetical protein
MAAWARDNVNTIVDDDTLWKQHQLLKVKLQAAAKTPAFAYLEKEASGLLHA